MMTDCFAFYKQACSETDKSQVRQNDGKSGKSLKNIF
jgi:hypothetical protein